MPQIFKSKIPCKFLQKVLRSKGLYTGEIDGRYGPKTKVAIIKLQALLRGFGVYWGKYTGMYDQFTMEAIARWQKLHPPLIPDGIIGPLTIGTLIPEPLHDRQYLEKSETTVRSSVTGKHYPHESKMREFYGKIGSNQTRILLPHKVKIAWAPEKQISKITCHKLVAEDLQSIYEETLEHYSLDGIQQLRLDMWGGILNVRKIRGGSRYSIHAWGAAEDRDPARNQLHWHKPKAEFSKKDYFPFWKIVEKHGSMSLGRRFNYDWMHHQFAHR